MKTILAVLLVVLVSGCEVTGRAPTPIRAPLPIIEVPPQPTLEVMSQEDLDAFRKLPESAQNSLLENDARLKLWAKQQNAAIKTYNAFAEENNTLNAKTMGLPIDKEKPK